MVIVVKMSDLVAVLNVVNMTVLLVVVNVVKMTGLVVEVNGKNDGFGGCAKKLKMKD